MINAALSREDGLAEHQLSNDAAHGPDIDVGAIVGISEDELRGAVVARADVGNVWLALDQLLCAAKVAQFEDVGASVDEDVLRLDISVADSLRVDVRNRAQKLVRVELDEKVGDHLFHFQVLLHHAIGRVGNKVHDNIEVDLLGLVAVSVERLAHLDAVRVVQHLQDLQLTVLVPFVLEHLLDRHRFACLRNRGLEDHTKGTVADDFLRIISEALLLSEEK